MGWVEGVYADAIGVENTKCRSIGRSDLELADALASSPREEIHILRGATDEETIVIIVGRRGG